MPVRVRWEKFRRDHCAPDFPPALELWTAHGPDLAGMRVNDIRERYGCSFGVARFLRHVVGVLKLETPPEHWPRGYADPGPYCDDPVALRASVAPPAPAPSAAASAPAVVVEDVREADYDFDEDADVYRVEVNGRRGGTHRVSLPGDVVRSLRADYSTMVGRGATQAELARKYEIPRPLLPSVLRKLAITHADDPFTDEQIEAAESADDLVEDALHLRRAKVGRKVERAVQRQMEKDAEKWADLEQSIRTATRAAVSDLVGGEVTVPRTPMRAAHEPYAAVIGLSDWHYNMRAGAESRTPYDCDTAVACLDRSLARIIAELEMRGRPERIILHLAGDNEHTELHARATSKGTPQVCEKDPRIAHEEAIRLLWVRLILPLGGLAPVDAYLTPGNHGEGAEAATGAALRILAEQTDGRVSVTWAVKRRLYASYGACGFQFDHGHRMKPTKLRELFAQEEAELWGRSRLRRCYQGHLHHDHTKDTGGAIWVLWPSLSGSCGWAEGAGHTGAERRMDCHLFSPEGYEIARVLGHAEWEGRRAA